ncbi:SH3 domain-binding glutamic acid-rich-like protein 3 [Plectropomus leopardus]|uniref:SH3 domain-binding glutamic acid-rich-like protein 3 n=1 Tax=Plectropomus leopardus TaxID=160734 RepID=UPI001C4BA734|nr:SH3 domain-binding glutamic acid-rich-like protein 3 [Plectropomus leopardus]
MSLRLFYTSVSSNLTIKKQQQHIQMVLDSKTIKYELVDISVSEEDKNLMRKLAGNPTALPPQICKGDNYCGDYAAFENAVEAETLEKFLKL